jgi:hypothetical protein
MIPNIAITMSGTNAKNELGVGIGESDIIENSNGNAPMNANAPSIGDGGTSIPTITEQRAIRDNAACVESTRVRSFPRLRPNESKGRCCAARSNRIPWHFLVFIASPIGATRVTSPQPLLSFFAGSPIFLAFRSADRQVFPGALPDQSARGPISQPSRSHSSSVSIWHSNFGAS